MTDPLDPLGRIAAQAESPYPHPAVSEKAMETHWREFYGPEAEALPPDDLATEHQRAVGAVAECEAAIRADRPRQQSDFIRRDRMLTRLARLVGRRDALAAEAERGAGR